MRGRLLLSASVLLSGCTIHQMASYTPNTTPPAETSDAAAASASCFESSTPAERIACANPPLAAANRELALALAAKLRDLNLFGRDALMASERVWRLSLNERCGLSTDAGQAAPPHAVSCLQTEFESHLTLLRGWNVAPYGGLHALAHYVEFRPAANVPDGGPVCGSIARAANDSIARTGDVDPKFFGAEEIAGSHGSASGIAGALRVSVAMRDANVFGGFQRRASAVAVNGATVLDSLSLGQAMQERAGNQGGRFSAYASQTGDYGAIDVFSLNGRVLALLEDAWGFNAPAAPGEFAHAGLWDLSASPPAPLCFYDTFRMPSEAGIFDSLPNFAPWRTLLGEIRDSVPSGLGVAALRDQSQLRTEAEWIVLNMPLLAAGEARGDWTPWLRHRHDQVLDALFAWSNADPSRHAQFDRLFALLRPAAADLVRAYQQSQALSGEEAKAAAAVAVMELMYGSVETIAPSLGADENAPESAAGVKPRYPILASPS